MTHTTHKTEGTNKTAYPLCWPEGWRRTHGQERRSSKFCKVRSGGGTAPVSIQDARVFLAGELDRLGAENAILSTNVRLRLDGAPYSDHSEPMDVGVAVYFTLKNRQVVLACDKWDRVADNIQAIAKHVEALRGQERWGVGNLEQAFRGYAALAERTESSEWWRPLGVAVNAAPAQVKEAYRLLARKYHPDTKETGDAELFRRVQGAWEEYQRQQNSAANGTEATEAA